MNKETLDLILAAEKLLKANDLSDLQAKSMDDEILKQIGDKP